MEFKYKDITEEIIKIFYKVYNNLGYGFLEKVYQNALMFEFEKAGTSADTQLPINVVYDGKTIGEYFADILVDNSVIVEIKAAKSLLKEHEAQLLNFGPKPEIMRKAFDNNRK
ncbi:GxxExxY protein [candidate division WOR-3 bacterium]|nr:GxxExxY protein [candidate division WOR-3 bacterium]